MNNRTLLALGLAALINGCGEDFLRETSSPGFADGYRSGCDNGSSTASNKTGQFVRDDKRYLNDAEYARGWRAGNRECDGENFKANPNDPLQPIEIDGPQGVYDH